MSKSRTKPDSGFCNPKSLQKGPNGRPLCRHCRENEVTPPRRTFCSDNCVHEHRLRSDPGYLRAQVYLRDKGVCAECGVNTTEWERELNRLGFQERYAFRQRLGLPEHRYSFWDADHILPVAEGGGECDLSNIRTLCLPCHKKATAALRKRLADQRKPAPKPWIAPEGQEELPL